MPKIYTFINQTKPTESKVKYVKPTVFGFVNPLGSKRIVSKPTYNFIHPTKTGGSACCRFFKNNYNEYIKAHDHGMKCKNDNNPIIIIRDIYDRFISMYKYWKNGSEHFKRDNTFLDTYKNYTIKDFIELVKFKKNDVLNLNFTDSIHFQPINNWINKTNYKNIIVIKYEKNMNNKIQRLIKALHIPNKGVALSNINVSTTCGEVVVLDEEDKEFIKAHLIEDYNLMETINKSPHLFKMVI
jgi:hypothetical protein